MNRNKSIKIAFTLLVFVELVLFGIFIYSFLQYQHITTTSIQGDIKNDPKYMINEQWISVAQKIGVPQIAEKRVSQLLQDTLSKNFEIKNERFSSDLQPYMFAFLQQFGQKFHNKEEAEGFSYTFVWLVVVAISQEKVSQEILNQTFEEFKVFVDTINDRIRSDLQTILGQDFVKFEKQIDEGIAGIKKVLIRRFKILQENPFFPAFKKQIDKEFWDKAINVVLSLENYPKYEDPEKMMASKERFYVSRLEGFFNNCPTLLLYEIAKDNISSQILNNPYWEQMNFYTLSTQKDLIWPIEIQFLPIKIKSFEKDQNNRDNQY